MKEGTSSGSNQLNNPLCWAQLRDDASGYMTDWSRGTTWEEYARRIARECGTSLKVMHPDGTWRRWSPHELVPPDENAPR